jgi:hypothetical protein
MAAGAGAGCSATLATGAGAAVCSTTVAAGAGSATAASFGLVAQADKTTAEKSKATGKTALCILDMMFSSETVDKRHVAAKNPPTVIPAAQTPHVELL